MSAAHHDELGHSHLLVSPLSLLVFLPITLANMNLSSLARKA